MCGMEGSCKFAARKDSLCTVTHSRLQGSGFCYELPWKQPKSAGWREVVKILRHKKEGKFCFLATEPECSISC